MLATLLVPVKARHRGDGRQGLPEACAPHKMNATMGISVLYAGGPFLPSLVQHRGPPRKATPGIRSTSLPGPRLDYQPLGKCRTWRSCQRPWRKWSRGSRHRSESRWGGANGMIAWLSKNACPDFGWSTSVTCQMIRRECNSPPVSSVVGPY
jgi:hypothetical protein